LVAERRGAMKGKFRIGVVCVKIYTMRGEEHLEDWAYRDRGEARVYAQETSCCDDVLRVEYENIHQKIFEVYVGGELITPDKAHPKAA